MIVAIEPLPSHHIAVGTGRHRRQSTSLLALSLALPIVESPLLVSLPHRSTVFSAFVIVSGRLPMSELMRLNLLTVGG